MGKRAKREEELEKKARNLVQEMTLEEKASLCSGLDCWNTKEIERLHIKKIMMSDGPHGLRKQVGDNDNLGIGDSVPAVCFPTASAIACSFDRDLVYKVGKAMGEECNKEGVSILLGPGICQKRSPLCGRNFEYYSEDPVVSGLLGASMIQGIQSTGTKASLKHFAVNNQEKRRMTINAIVDERTLYETYLKAFEIAIKEGKPATVMCSYNRLNGVYNSENKTLLTDILRKKWKYGGVVISDWGAVHDRVEGIRSGEDMEMPGNGGINDRKIVEAVKNKTLKESELDASVVRITKMMLECMESREKKRQASYDKKQHHKLAIRAEQESAVLLKNEGHILPGKLTQKAAVIGALAKKPRYQAAGSSKIHPIKVDTPYQALTTMGLAFEYAAGYEVERKKETKSEKRHQQELIEEACNAAKGKDIVYLFAGLVEGYESEGFDREDMSLPKEQNRLIEEVLKCNSNVVVVLMGGAPMKLPWNNKVKGILLAYLGGEGVGTALANLLLGEACPCGKLAETWPLSLADTPCFQWFPGGRSNVEYREGIYVGYRYYEKANKPVRYGFGHGLSYAKFIYSNLSVKQDVVEYGKEVEVRFSITNCGSCKAMETAFLFVSHKNETVFLPEKELVDFVKVSIEAGETKEITRKINTKAFSYYNTKIGDWYAESGRYMLLVGTSLENANLSAPVTLVSKEQPQPDLRKEAGCYYKLPQGRFEISDAEYLALYQRKLPKCKEKAARPFTSSNTLEDASHTLAGKLLIKYADHVAGKTAKKEKEQQGMMSSMIREMPFFAMVTSSDGMISERMMEGILDLLNGHWLKGILKILK